MFVVNKATFINVIAFFWIGFFLITVTLRSGLNKRHSEPSLTMYQLLWGTSFLLTMTYYFNEWRGLILMPYFGLLSFGFFKLRFRELLSVSLFAILGYTIIIIYIFNNDPDRLIVKLELLQLLAFTGTTLTLLFTGSAINQLREKAKGQYLALQEVTELNKTLATTDELTGLYNRRYFIEKLNNQKALSERDDSDFVLCFLDLDHFKIINDNFGHHTGDIVLQKFSEIIRASIREVDCAARFGGEEFVCLLVNTNIEDAITIAERIRHTLESYNFSDVAPSLSATVSIGLSNFKQYNTIQETLTSADNRMYLAKKNGRNQVVSADVEE